LHMAKSQASYLRGFGRTREQLLPVLKKETSGVNQSWDTKLLDEANLDGKSAQARGKLYFSTNPE